MPTLLDTLASYIPALIVQRHTASAAPLTAPAYYPLQAAGLFADISGFMVLTERLAGRGPFGVEELTRVLNVSFGQILDLIEIHGGDVVKFAGDALLALWPSTDEGLAAATLRATQCALEIHARLANFYRLIDSVQLALRIGVAAGDMAAIQVGGVYGRWEFLVAGEPLIQMGAAQHLARPGEVVLAPEAWGLVSNHCTGTPVQNSSTLEMGDRRVEITGESLISHLPSLYVRLDAIHMPLPPRPAQRPALTPSMDAALRSFIPGAVLSRLVTGETAWLAELRRVTVLFINLPMISSTIRIEQAQTVVRTIQTALYRYEGSLNKLSFDDKGATLVAALGLPPLAHEDDAARGVQAALAIVQALREMELRCTIGVASGQAFCGEIGSHYRREYTMIGDVVNLAARLMQATGPRRPTTDDRPPTTDVWIAAGNGAASAMGHEPQTSDDQSAIYNLQSAILCDEATFQLARSRIAFTALPPIVVKGKVEPVAVFYPIGEASGGPEAQTRGLKFTDELVGRVAEQAALADQLHALLRGDPGGVVLIEGEAGMGKSTLIERLRQLAAGLQIATLLGAGDATEQSTPYYAWRPIFGQLLDMGAPGAPEARVLELLGAGEAALAPLLNAVLPLGLPESQLTAQLAGQRRAEAIRDLLLRLLQRAAARAPHLLILEDTHWCDSASWELALAVSQRVRPLLLVAALRPPHSHGSDDAGPPEYRQLLATAKAQLRLDALAPEEAIALACRRLGVAALPEPVAALIREKAQGHPFFSEELAYALRDAGLIQIAGGVCQLAPAADLRALAFPDTVQGAIISRVDRLTSTQQLTLKVASVIGRIFPVRTLRAVYPVATDGVHLSSDLAALARLDITPLEAPEPDLTYIFKHAITQDVVYNLMLFAQRRQLHRAVAEWYEAAFGSAEFRVPSGRLRSELAHVLTQTSKLRTQNSKLAPYYPLLAHHWGKAGVAAKAIDYLEKVGHSALAISALREARAAFEQALELLAASAPADEPAALHRRAVLTRLLGEAQHQLGDFAAARAALERSLALMRDLGHHDGMTDALSLLGRVATDMGAYAEARRNLEAALALARELGDQVRTARALSNLGNIAMREAAYVESERYYQESLALFTAIGDRPGTAQVFNGMGNGAVDRRMYDVARYCYQESLAIRVAIGDRWGVASCLSNLGWVAHLQGDFAGARAHYEESLGIVRAIGDRRGTVIALNNLGFTLCELRDDGAAAACFDEALRIAAEIGAVPLALEVLVGLARLRARAGQPEPAAELLGLALHHPASNSDVKIQVELFLGELADALAPELLDAAITRGGELELAAVVAEIVGGR